jgi:hypothetical protein
VNHFTRPSFWKHYENLPTDVQTLADKNYALLKENPRHPSLHFKLIRRFWSVRIGEHHRALGLDSNVGVVWFWIGPHDEYETLLKSA